ncbi:hypothetical protein Zmor_021197 [Zophobas morio]|uniref:Peptidase S1 domain-containing protein n=1 Tax=Zophobas morio TaxID=2755281 RepID=A0AA38I5I9_9CUCU|nr:hypothetical protein Zmor_021197 [Zophobas morio]
MNKMFPFAIICLCVSSTWALPSLITHSRDVPFKFPGPRIINGDPASEGQFPWQVGLYISGENSLMFCGGSIISEEWILTAGHCTTGGVSAQVISGSISLDLGTTSNASEIIVHEDFDPQIAASDIGLIKLDTPLKFDENTAAVGLAEEELGADVTFTISGWGHVSDGSTELTEVLNYVDLVTISNDDCQGFYGNSIRPEMVCATSGTDETRSSCSGDSGGAAVVNADSDPVQVAIVSFVSFTGCEMGAPSGYTRTAYFRDWIKDKTGI